MEKDPKKQEDIEKIKRVLYLLYNSNYCLNFFERTYQKDLGLLKLKFETIKTEKPWIVFKKAPKTKDVTYVFLDLNLQCNGVSRNTVSKAKISNEDAVKFETEIQQQGYLSNTGRNPGNIKVYKLPA